MTTQVYTHHIQVTKDHIDARNHVNNVVYLEWCLQAAEGHWETTATEEMKEAFVWYVLNHYIEYKISAFEGEELEVKTWVSTIEGVKTERRYEIWRPADNKLLVEAKTLWCLLNAKTLRPTKITDEITTLFNFS